MKTRNSAVESEGEITEESKRGVEGLRRRNRRQEGGRMRRMERWGEGRRAKRRGRGRCD